MPEVLDVVDENRSLMKPFDKDRKNWLNHVLRSAYSHRRQNGRDKNSWETECYDHRLNDVEYEHIKKRAYDREDWRHWKRKPA